MRGAPPAAAVRAPAFPALFGKPGGRSGGSAARRPPAAKDLAVNDAKFMREALGESRKVTGRTGDNPAVGCVVVRDGAIVARGATQPPGGAHAEVMAVREAEAGGHALGECDFFVTLEPCTFQGRTPPCSGLLIEKRPRRIVIAIEDPHPQVSGRGIMELRRAGIEVVEGVLAEEVSVLLEWWLQRNSQPG